MAIDAIDAIKQAELNADKVIESAKSKADRIIEHAKDEATRVQQTILKAARSKSNLMVGIEKSHAQIASTRCLVQAHNEIKSLSNISEYRKHQAVHRIFEKIMPSV